MGATHYRGAQPEGRDSADLATARINTATTRRGDGLVLAPRSRALVRMTIQLAALVSLVGACAAGCGGNVVRVPRSVPAIVQKELAHVSRVWVAGFLTGGRSEVDLNTETVRLVRGDLRRWSRAQVVDAEPLFLDNNDRIHDVEYWRRLGEEQGSPLIVTGSVKLLLAPAAMVQRGRRTLYLPTGRVLESTVVLIDGQSGEVVASRKLPSRMRYSDGVVTSSMSLFYQMMDESMADWLAAIAAAPE